jgi:hypothetical protein
VGEEGRKMVAELVEKPYQYVKDEMVSEFSIVVSEISFNFSFFHRPPEVVYLPSPGMFLPRTSFKWNVKSMRPSNMQSNGLLHRCM